MLEKQLPFSPRVVIPAILLGGLIASIGFPQTWFSLALVPCGTALPSRLLGHAFYWLVFANFSQWLVASASIVLALSVIGSSLSLARVAMLAMVGSVVAGVLYAHLAPDCSPFVGPYPIAWTLSGLAIAFTVANWQARSKWSKLYVVSVCLSMSIMVTMPTYLFAGQFAALLAGVLAFVLWFKNDLSQR